MRGSPLLVAAIWAVRAATTPTPTNSTCSPLPIPDLLADPALVGLEAGYVPYAQVPVDVPGFCAKFEIIIGEDYISYRM
jgi:hypothetical protein